MAIFNYFLIKVTIHRKSGHKSVLKIIFDYLIYTQKMNPII